jgi:hypothetical protein
MAIVANPLLPEARTYLAGFRRLLSPSILLGKKLRRLVKTVNDGSHSQQLDEMLLLADPPLYHGAAK